MGARSAIEWTDATVNFWWGCTKLGPGCALCYAEAWAKRTGGKHWGAGVPRRKIKGAVRLLHRLDNDYADWAADFHSGHAAPGQGPRRRVFIQSMADLMDTEVPLDWFAEAWGCIEACDRVDVQIVTKRISAVEKRLAAIGRTTWPQHAGLIVTVVDQAEADRDVPRLLALKARLGIPWVGLSCEPLLGAIDLHEIIPDPLAWTVAHGFDALDWVIVGGESGVTARPMHPDWARSLRDQCAGAGVPFFFKQWGAWLPGQNDPYPPPDGDRLGQSVAHWQDGGWGARDCKPPAARNYVMWAPDGTMHPGGSRSYDNLFEVAAWAARVGKKRAGRLLDGVTHDAMPVALGGAA